MHWLPLVAMVIASALPFPHDPASRIVAATATTSDLSSRDQSEPASASLPRHDTVDPSSHLPSDSRSAPVDYRTAPVDHNTADGEQQGPKGVSSAPEDGGVYELNHGNALDAPPTAEQTDTEIFSNSDFNMNDGARDSSPPQSVEMSPSLRTGRGGRGLTESSDTSPVELDALFEEEDMFLDAHPRVLFSTSAFPPDHPPELLMPDSEDSDWDALAEGHGDREDSPRAGLRREKRSHSAKTHSFDGRWVQRSVCESENRWVMGKTSAVDTRGNNVSILQEIQTQTGPIKQYFYETRCRQAEWPQGGRGEETGVESVSCLGIDKKQWRSKCVAKQSFVRALTKDKYNRVGWRWIRIDSSCVCVLLSRTGGRG